MGHGVWRRPVSACCDRVKSYIRRISGQFPSIAARPGWTIRRAFAADAALLLGYNVVSWIEYAPASQAAPSSRALAVRKTADDPFASQGADTTAYSRPRC